MGVHIALVAAGSWDTAALPAVMGIPVVVETAASIVAVEVVVVPTAVVAGTAFLIVIARVEAVSIALVVVGLG